MEISTSSVLDTVDVATLTGVIRRSLRRDELEIQDWHVRQLGGGVGNPVSVGLYRLEGTGLDRDEQVPWSAILKIIQSPANLGLVGFGEGDDQTHWNYWKRELFVYGSGLLETLPEGLAAPRCFGTVELPGNIAWLWLEEIRDSYGGVWPLERYALAARHLGRLNGTYLSTGTVPTFPWLSQNLTRQWIPGAAQIESFPWDHPLTLRRYPRPEANTFRRLLLERERFLARLDQVPKTVCHGDTYPTNFMSRLLSGGREQTVVVDWALVGVGPLGDDLGQFVLGAQTKLVETRPADIENALFDSYVDGLRESGCREDPQLVRFAFTASAALRVGLFQFYLLNEEILKGEPVSEEEGKTSPGPDCFEVVMADKAYALLEAI